MRCNTTNGSSTMAVYQTNLTDGGSISGSGTATLTVSNVSPANVGAYSVVITNAAGSATSTVAFLGIVPWRPVITVQPRQPDDPARRHHDLHRRGGWDPALHLSLAEKRNQFNRWRQHPRLRHQHLDRDQRHGCQRRDLFGHCEQQPRFGHQRRSGPGPHSRHRSRRCPGHALLVRRHQLWIQSVMPDWSRPTDGNFYGTAL